MKTNDYNIYCPGYKLSPVPLMHPILTDPYIYRKCCISELQNTLKMKELLRIYNNSNCSQLLLNSMIKIKINLSSQDNEI